MSRDPRDVVIRPIITEETTGQMALGKYTFQVAVDATKPEIRRAIEELFKVKVTAVNTMRRRGKPRRFGRYQGYRPDWKRAVVTLAEGQRIQAFEALR